MLANLNDLPMTLTTQAPVNEVPSEVPSAPPWHALPVEQVLAQLACDPASGLSATEVVQRRAQGGENTLPEPPRRSTLAIIARQFKSPLIYILFVAAVLAMVAAGLGVTLVSDLGLSLCPPGVDVVALTGAGFLAAAAVLWYWIPRTQRHPVR